LKILKPEYSRIDERGKLIQLISGDWKQANLIEIKRGHKFGGHYHKKKNEFFYVLKGHVMVMVSKDDITQSVFVTEGGCFLIEPYDKHTFEAIEDTLIIELLSHKYSEEDTYE
jgi:mannose-6-phosphate isomerase-like protein (cupin superfamily)